MSLSFAKVHTVDANDEKTWADKIFLTFDIDWAADFVIHDTIDLLEKGGAEATFLVTHDTPVLQRIRDNPKFEIGIHPNFNFLLNGDFRLGSTYIEVIDRMLEIVPEAKTVRSHSMTQSSKILQAFGERGLTHDCNNYVPEHAGVQLKPWILWNDMVSVPHYWEDDVVCVFDRGTSMSDLVQRKGVKVFDFHPIHVFMNTEHLDRYERSRPDHRDPEKLSSHIYNGLGTRAHLKQLMGLE